MHEEDLGAAIGVRLHEEMAGVTAGAGLATAVRRRRSRQRWATGTALAVPLLAGGVALALVGGGSPAHRTTPPAAAHPGSAAADVRLRDVAYVSARSQQALGTIDQYVVHETVAVDGQPRQQSWADGAGVRWLSVSEPVGNPPTALLVTLDGDKLVSLQVDYRAHTYFRVEDGKIGGKATQGFGVNFGNTDELRSQMHDGTFTMVGQEQVDGRDAVHLRLNLPETDNGQTRIDLWVDAQSFLPLKMTGAKGGTPMAVAYEWLPRSSANLARIALTVPAGFTQVDPGKAGNPAVTPDSSPKG